MSNNRTFKKGSRVSVSHPSKTGEVVGQDDQWVYVRLDRDMKVHPYMAGKVLEEGAAELTLQDLI